MAGTSDNPYLRDAVLTAPPEQLQMMLYDGAIRFATQGRDAIQAEEVEKSFDLLTRAQKIMLELINGLREEVDPPLVRRMASLYMFIYRKLVEANVNRDVAAVDEALKLLAHQRETWVLLLSKLRTDEGGRDKPSITRTPPADSAVGAMAVASDPVCGPPGADSFRPPGQSVLSVEG